MKKISMILVAVAMVLSMAQCKKNEATDQNETVTITLDVKQNNGAKVEVNPTLGTVDFESGDKVYVGSGGKYVGFLTHNGTNFVGNITNPTEGQPLQFYFLGNVIPQETLGAGTTETCSVVISDQTEQLPVISCAPSFENYESGVTAYTGHLLNKCALVKFNVTTPSNSPICITGMKNKVTVDFSQNTVTPSMDGEGVIKLPASAGDNVERWAILLPQEALEEGEEGTVYSEDGTYIGTRPSISVITENDYLAEGIILTLDNSGIPAGAINGLYTINDNGDQVYFSQGNLQYRASPHTWRFANNQFDLMITPEDMNLYSNIWGLYYADVSTQYTYYYNSWIDLFGWGTSGWNSGNSYYYPWNSESSFGSLFGPPGQYDLTGWYANADWGVYNQISNGGNAINQWRTLTWFEWNFVFNTRSTISGIRYAKANVNGVNGVILLPDDWNTNTYSLNAANTFDSGYDNNTLSAFQWETLENAGAVFLPAAGCRSHTSVIHVGSIGSYWTSTCSYVDSNGYAFELYFDESHLQTDHWDSRGIGRSVRLVCNAE